MRILVLTSGTGGGHVARAEAFRRWAQARTDWQVRIHHALERTHSVYRFGVHCYNWIQRLQPRLHHVYFNALELAALHRHPGRILGARRFNTVLEEFRPDVLLSTHAHLNHGFFELARRALGPGRVRCVTYCGELSGGYGFSRHWVNPQADLFIGAVEAVAAAARALGMPAERTWTGGFLLDPGYYEAPAGEREKETFVRETLGLDPARFTLLLATGAAGANDHLALLDRIARSGEAIQIVALCGRRARTLQQVRRWADAHPEMRVAALPYWERMPLLVQSVSALVARPGTATTSEAILCARPLIANGIGGIMPQESLTVRFGLEHRILKVMRRPSDLPPILNEWRSRPASLTEIAAAMRRIRPARHPRDILAAVAGAPLEATAVAGRTA